MIYTNLLLTNLEIFTDTKQIENGYIKLLNGKIAAVVQMNNLTDIAGFNIIELPDQAKAIPGMIDLHIHGNNGADTMDATLR